MIVAGHQADLFPYSGFWFKMAHADIFDVKIYDQFQARGYQRRVLMRGTWASVPISGGSRQCRIRDIRIDPAKARDALCAYVQGRYRGSRYWNQRGDQVLAMIEETDSDLLWHLNFTLILGIRDLLGITTPVGISPPPAARGAHNIIGMVRSYGATAYLSGQGARAYMGDCRDFAEAGIDVIWSDHRAVTSDSVLTVIMDYADPMAVITATNSSARTSA
jgi:hypothetical protein